MRGTIANFRVISRVVICSSAHKLSFAGIAWHAHSLRSTLTPLDFAFTQLSFRPSEWPSISLLFGTVLSIMTVCLGLQTT